MPRQLGSAAVAAMAVLAVALALATSASGGNHTNNWAVLVGASRFWFNYRHVANTLSVYRSVQRLGIPDSQILLLLADDMACSPRNVFPGTVFNDPDHRLNLYGESAEVDYRGYEVTPETLVRVLTGRHAEHVPRSKRLLTDASSNLLVFLTGHGGDGFIKFHDSTELTARDLADALESMRQESRFNEALVIVDSCQAASLADEVTTRGVLAVGSSARGQPSLAHSSDATIGQPLVDSFTYYALQFLEQIEPGSRATLAELRTATAPALVRSDPGWRVDLFSRPLEQVLVTEFFAGAADARAMEATESDAGAA